MLTHLLAQLADHSSDILGFVMTITFMFNVGDIDADLSDATQQPWVAVIYRITGSKAATIILLVVMIIMVRCSFDLIYPLMSAVLLLRSESGHNILSASLCIRSR